MDKLDKQLLGDEHDESDLASASTDELLWIVARSLSTTSKKCNQSIENLHLFHYHTGESIGDDTDASAELQIADLQNLARQSIEELELIFAALDELSRRKREDTD